MNHRISKLAEGRLLLEMGLRHSISFEKDATLDDIIEGVLKLIGLVTGINAFEVAADVSEALENTND